MATDDTKQTIINTAASPLFPCGIRGMLRLVLLIVTMHSNGQFNET